MTTLCKVERFRVWPVTAVASQVALVVKNLLATAGDEEMWVRSWGGEDPLEKKMATHSSILSWRIPWTEEPEGLQSQESDTTEHSHMHVS